MRNAYNDLHVAGYAHSAEVRLNGELVGGLYGVRHRKNILWRKYVQPVQQRQQICIYQICGVFENGGC